MVDEFLVQLISGKVASIKLEIDYIFGEGRRTLFFQTMETTHLDMVLCGNPEDLCVKEWEKHTDYGEYQINGPHIASFWKVNLMLITKLY